jgi:hypothetical protein
MHPMSAVGSFKSFREASPSTMVALLNRAVVMETALRQDDCLGASDSEREANSWVCDLVEMAARQSAVGRGFG